MKLKTKGKFKQILSGILAGCFGLFALFPFGCAPLGDVAEDIGLAGIKVLRRSSSYNYNENVVEEGKNYYSQFSQDILNNLFRVYGVLNSYYQEDNRAPGNDIFDALKNKEENDGTKFLNDLYSGADKENLKYFYDAIRYQIISETTQEVKNGEGEVIDTYVEVIADTSKAWNWVKNYQNFTYIKDVDVHPYENSIEPFVYSVKVSKSSDSRNMKNFPKILNKYDVGNEDEDMPFKYQRVEDYYKDEDIFSYSTHQSAFVNDNFICTLGYAIYSIVLELPVAKAGFNSSGVWVVDGYDSAQDAFEKVQNTFYEYGSYVGLTKKNKQKIKDYILDEVIGAEAQIYVGQDLYYKDIVSAVVEYCGELTTIGLSDDGSADTPTNVGSSFIASEVVDYPSTSFFVSADDDDEFKNIGSYEYQSLILMPEKRIEKLTDIWLDFYYIAKDKDGRVLEPAYANENELKNLDASLVDKSSGYLFGDRNQSLKINVEVRCLNVERDEKGVVKEKEYLTASSQIVVYNQYFSAGKDHSFLELNLDQEEFFGKPVNIDPFECDALDVSKNSKKKTDLLSGAEYFVITGFTSARHYYEVVNSTLGFGGHGVLNKDKISAEKPDMGYLEIAFDIEKTDMHAFKNYDFKVGFSNLHQDDRDFSWVK